MISRRSWLSVALAAVVLILLHLPIHAQVADGPVYLQGDTIVRGDGSPVNQPSSAVVRLRVAFGDNVCTGFYVGNRTLVTAGHCYFALKPKPDKFVAVLDNGKELVASLVYASDAANGGADIALLHIDDPIPDGWTPDQINCDWMPRTGDDVTTQGYPAANPGLTFSKGYVNGEQRVLFGNELIPVTMPISPGNSGSPVYHDGKAIGVLVSINTQQPAWSYVQPIKPVCDRLG